MIKNITIKNFLGVEDVEIKDLNNINIFVGRRLKSDILEEIYRNIEDKEKTMLINYYGICHIKNISILERNYLFIDNIEYKLHYSEYKIFWDIIINLAKTNKTQIFLTTDNAEMLDILANNIETNSEIEKYISGYRIAKLNDDNEKFINKYRFF